MGVISFARGVPAPECLPVAELADCARTVLERDGETVLNYGPVGGYGPLREWVAERHGVEPGRVLVTNGSLPGLNLVLGHFAEQSRRILVEAPTYDRPLKIAARLGVDVRTVSQDDQGIDVDALADELRHDPSPAFLYVLPTFQNPSGRTLPLERRRRLVELAREHRLTVLEDDPYGRVRFDGEALPTLFELDGGENVLYSSSFSKIVSPGVRVGYFVVPAEIAAALEGVAANVYLTPVLVGQAIVHEFIRRGSLEPNIDRVTALLKARRDAMIDALQRDLPDVRCSRPEGGYFLWLDLPESVDAGELLVRAEAAGVTFVRGTDFFPAASGLGRSAARLAFSYVSPEEIREGVSRLAHLLAPVAAV
jgi:2-aminoadipate transaminase